MAQCFLQFIDIVDHDVPNAPRISTKVFMDNSIADARYRTPGNIWMRGLECGT